MNAILKKFLIRAAIIFVVWTILYQGFIKPNGTTNSFLTSLVIDVTVTGLKLLNYEAEGLDDVIYINGEPSVLVADPCNGLELFVLYIGFILAFPGRIKYKLFFIPLGLAFIFLANIVREIALALNYQYFRETFEINHKYTYTFIVYIFIFLMWRFWLKRYSILGSVS